MINTREAADLIGVTIRAVQRWIKQGSLTAQRKNGQYVIDQEDLLELAQKKGLEVTSKQGADTERRATMRKEEGEEGRLYVFEGSGHRIVLNESDYQRLARMYSNWAGKPANIDQICAEFRLTRPEFMVIRSAASLTHTAPPFTDDELLERPIEELEEESLAAIKQQLHRRFQSGKHRRTQEAAAKWYAHEERTKELVESLLGQQWDIKAPNRGSVKQPDLDSGESERLLVLFPTDLHYGKYGSPVHAPGGANRTQAVTRVYQAIERVLADGVAAGIDAVCFYAGSDGTNMDNLHGGTTRGTPQDNDGLPTEIATESLYLWFQLIEFVRQKLRELGREVPVYVRVQPGNHDKLLSFVYGAALDIAYRDCEDVHVAPECAEYQYMQWGKTVILTHHGDGRHSTTDLAQTMSTQRPDLWHLCPYRYALRGNLHHVKDEEGAGIRNLLLPSLSGSDAYHASKWPVQSRPLLRAPLFDSQRGLVAIYEAGPAWDEKNNEWGYY